MQWNCDTKGDVSENTHIEMFESVVQSIVNEIAFCIPIQFLVE